VKIQNWDKTISTIPTSKFISESFKNWRGMSESGGRRIKRCLHLDLSTIRFLTEDDIDRLSRYEMLAEYMTRKRSPTSGRSARMSSTI
jgi:miniconductance mechanosensitive channel